MCWYSPLLSHRWTTTTNSLKVFPCILSNPCNWSSKPLCSRLSPSGNALQPWAISEQTSLLLLTWLNWFRHAGFSCAISDHYFPQKPLGYLFNLKIGLLYFTSGSRTTAYHLAPVTHPEWSCFRTPIRLLRFLHMSNASSMAELDPWYFKMQGRPASRFFCVGTQVVKWTSPKFWTATFQDWRPTCSLGLQYNVTVFIGVWLVLQIIISVPVCKFNPIVGVA